MLKYEDLDLKIDARPDAPATTLHIRIVSKDEESRKTKPYIFMLPGGPGANHSHYKDYECLCSTGNIVFIDPRGCGLSAKYSSPHSMKNYIDDIEEIRQKLELEEIFVLGKSYGAMCGLGYTINYPKHVKSLILAAGAPSHKFLETARENIKRGNAQQQEICEKLWSGTFQSNEEVQHYLEVMASMYSWKIRNNQTVDRPKPEYAHAFEPLNDGFGDFLRTFDYEGDLFRIMCPTLILAGQEDWITDKCYSEFMAQQIKNSTLQIFEKADHSMESDVPKEFFASIASFIQKQLQRENIHSFFKSGENCAANKLDSNLTASAPV